MYEVYIKTSVCSDTNEKKHKLIKRTGIGLEWMMSQRWKLAAKFDTNDRIGLVT